MLYLSLSLHTYQPSDGFSSWQVSFSSRVEPISSGGTFHLMNFILEAPCLILSFAKCSDFVLLSLISSTVFEPCESCRFHHFQYACLLCTLTQSHYDAFMNSRFSNLSNSCTMDPLNRAKTFTTHSHNVCQKSQKQLFTLLLLFFTSVTWGFLTNPLDLY